MYHQVNIDLHSTKALLALMHLAHRTLAFGLSHDITDFHLVYGPTTHQPALIKALGGKIPSQYTAPHILNAVREAFIASFGTSRQAAAAWLWKKPAIIAAPVMQLLMLPQTEKSAFLPALKQDIKLKALFRSNSTDQLAYRTAACQYPATDELISKIMINFYEKIFAEGIKYSYLGQRGIRTFSRQVFLADYRSKNKNAVCSGCDAGKIEGIEEKQPKRGKTKAATSTAYRKSLSD